jgi:hypothetical protein
MRSLDSVLVVVIFTIAFCVYSANGGYLYTYDSAPTSLLVFDLLQNHTPFFDAFRDGYLYELGAGYVFRDVHGHLASIFPIGTAILTSPIFAFDYVTHGGGRFPNIASAAFEPMRLGFEKQAAAIVAALAVAVFYACARAFAGRLPAAIATFSFAFGTEMWTIGSQALWQHGSIELVLLVGILASCRARSSARFQSAYLVVAGLAAGFLPVVRPTALIFSIGLCAIAFATCGRRAFVLLAGFAIGIAPGLGWNLFAFGNAIGGYDVNESSFVPTVAQFAQGAAGLAFSPAKGILFFTPFVVVVPFAYARAFAGRERVVFASLAICALATFANYAFFERWLGGAAYGPRYLTDISVALALPLVYLVPERFERFRIAPTVVLAATIALATAVQYVGIVGEPKSNWSAIPLAVDAHPERVWRVRDAQIERDARTAYRLLRSNPTASTAYAAAFSGRVVTLSVDGSTARRTVAPGATILANARVRNDGTAAWYGYTTGMFYGQARVRVRIYDERGSEFGERYLYVVGVVPGGETVDAIGQFDAPRAPGTYRLHLDVDCFQNALVGERKNDEATDVALDVASPGR